MNISETFTLRNIIGFFLRINIMGTMIAEFRAKQKESNGSFIILQYYFTCLGHDPYLQSQVRSRPHR